MNTKDQWTCLWFALRVNSILAIIGACFICMFAGATVENAMGGFAVILVSTTVQYLPIPTDFLYSRTKRWFSWAENI